jgi:hypothetical protein
MFVWQSQRLARCINILCARLSMRLIRPCHFRDAFADERVRDNELRFPIVAPLRHVQRIEKLLHVVAIDFLDIEAIRLHAFVGVFALRFLRRGIQRDGI